LEEGGVMDDMKSGDKCWLGCYKTPREVADLLRQMADRIEAGPAIDADRCGAIVHGCLVQHDPHPGWMDVVDVRVTFNFRNNYQDVAPVLERADCWMLPEVIAGP
jgi:hypothetical protein